MVESRFVALLSVLAKGSFVSDTLTACIDARNSIEGSRLVQLSRKAFFFARWIRAAYLDQNKQAIWSCLLPLSAASELATLSQRTNIIKLSLNRIQLDRWRLHRRSIVVFLRCCLLNLFFLRLARSACESQFDAQENQ